MNISVLAALVVAALIVVALMLKKNKAAQKKPVKSEAAEQPVPLVAQPEMPREEVSEPEQVQQEQAITISAPVEEAEVREVVEAAEGPVVTGEPELEPELERESETEPEQEPEKVAADELEHFDLDAAPVLSEQEDEAEVFEPEAVEGATEPEEAVEEIAAAPEEVESLEEPVAVAVEAPEIAEPEPEVAEAPAEADREEPMVAAAPEAAEEEAVVVESPEAAVAEPVAMESEVAELMASPPPVETVLPVVRLTLDAYSARLNALEEQQRALLTQAIARRDDRLRDRLQRELVIMNDRLALVADSYVEEVACFQQVLETLEQLQGQVGDDTALEAAIAQLRSGEAAAAEEYLAKLGEPPSSLIGSIAFSRGRLAESRVDLQQALAFYRQAVEQEPDNPRYLRAAGLTARNLYQYKEALPWLESFVRLSRQNGDNDPLALAFAQRELAYTYVLSGQYQKSGPLYKEAMTTLAKKLGQDHPEMATSWQQIGELQETLGEYDKAVGLYKKALAILEKKRGPEHPALANILAKLAALCMELEMEKEAVPLYERLVQIREKALRPTHPQLAISLNSLAESYRLQGRYADAEGCYRKTLAINEAIHGPEHPSVAAVLQELAKLATSQRKPEEAKQYQERAAAIFQRSVEASEKKTGKDALTLEL